MNAVNRRHFLMSSMALPVALKASALQSPNNTVRVAVVGFNGRGKAHISAYLKMPNVEIAALCDVDQAVVDSGCKTMEAAGKKRPATYADIRRVLDDKAIDAVSIATPNFHHTLQTIWAVQAGKDVLVEKPVSYNMFEAQQIVAASRKYNRIVQNGTGAQLWLHEAKKKIKEGDHRRRLHGARAVSSSGATQSAARRKNRCPPGVAYDLWTGPAPAKPFTTNRFHYNWHWQWDYGNGDIGNQGAHQMHSARTALGVKYPTQDQLDGRTLHVRRRPGDAEHAGLDIRVRGRREEEAARVRSAPLDVEQRSGHRRAHAPVGGGRRSRCRPSATSGTGRRAISPRANDGWQTFMGKEGAPGPKSEADPGYPGFVNFIDVVRSRKREDQLAEVEEGAISTMLIHLANISYRTGRTLYFDPVTYTCKGDAEATAMFTRARSRAPFTVPKVGVTRTE